MTLDDLIARTKDAIAAKLAERKVQSDIIDEVRQACEPDERNLTTDEDAKVRAADTVRVQIDAQVDQLRATLANYESEKTRDEAASALAREFTPAAERSDRAHVVNEERTYTAEKSRRGEASFFSDSYRAEIGSDFSARDRLARHMTEVKVEGEMSARASNTTSYAGLIVPQYLVDQAALIARAGRPFANTLLGLELPDQGMSFHIPKGTTGASAAIQATENSSVSSTDEVLSDVVVPVATIAGQQDISRQSLERGTPGIDSLVYMDLAGAYAVALDAQVISGTGSSGQMLGVLNTAGINQATAFGAAATAATFYSKVAGQKSAIKTTRFMAPTGIAMAPRRWEWLESLLDTANRPLVVPNANGPMNAFAAFDSVVDTQSQASDGGFQGLPVLSDANIPLSVGTGPEDQVIVYRREDLLLWEDGDGMPKQLRFEQTLGNQLTIKLVVYGYAAFTAGRYPTSVGVVGGNAGTIGFGLIAPVF